MRGVFSISIAVGLFLSIELVEGGAILLGCTSLPVLSVLLFVIALLHQANIRLSALTSVLLRVVLRGLVIGVLSLGVDIGSLDSFFLNVS